MIQFDSVRRIHCVGIKGAGVSGLACILQKKGKEVCGSDIDEEFFTDDLLQSCGIVCEKFSPQHIEQSPIDMVIYSTAWKESAEVSAARAKGIPTLSYPEALGMLFDGAYGIAVAGSHGKTTTTGMLTHVLKQAGLDPTALVGSALSQYHTNAFSGVSQYVVIEADEYENKFRYYHPHALLVTNVDYDHPDYFSTPNEYDEVFKKFLSKTLESGGVAVVCADDEGIQRIAHENNSGSIIRYGINGDFPYMASEIEFDGPSVSYLLWRHGKNSGRYSLKLIGEHNVSNALGVIALCDTLGLVDAVHTAQLLESFAGTARRFEYKGKQGSILIYDDFAHHPREIATTLLAARNAFPEERIWCIFGSHTFSRTQALLADFAKSFGSIQRVLILDIYGSAREEKGTIRGVDLADAITAVSGNAQYVGTHEAALQEIARHVDEIDVLITMGAGDVGRIADSFLQNNT